MEFRLKSGRTIVLKRFHLSGTFAGVCEGTPETATPYILKGADRDAARALPPGEPLVVIDLGKVPLPPYRLVAELESPTGVEKSDPDFASYLYVCWFVDDPTPGIDHLVGSILEAADWEANARDFDKMDF